MPVQIPPPSPATSDTGFVEELIALGRTFRKIANLKLAKIGVMSGQDELLIAITDSRSLTMSQLADVIKVNPTTTTKMVNLLVKAGWCVRERKAGDGRLVFVSLTPAGVVKQDEIRSVRAALELELAGILNKTKILPILETLDHTLHKQVLTSKEERLPRARDHVRQANPDRRDTARTRSPAVDHKES